MTSNQTIFDKLKKLKPGFESEYGVVALGVFGSVARNEVSDNSDIDIVVEMTHVIPFALTHIKEKIEKECDAPVDIVRLRKLMNPVLKKEIDRDVIYV